MILPLLVLLIPIHSYNSFLLMVTKTNWNVTITPKVVKPTVEKEVFDNFDNQDGTSTGGFGSSADHAINEKFQFRLTATLPKSEKAMTMLTITIMKVLCYLS